MSKVRAQCEVNGAQCAKKAKTDTVPIFHSPLNDVIAPPRHNSKCTWNRINDKTQINPHSQHDW